MDIKTLQKEAFKNAQNKGFWPETITPEVVDQKFGDQMMLVVSEVAEGYECWRGGEPLLHYGRPSPASKYLLQPELGFKKPEGLLAELADVVIRAAQLAEAVGGDLEDAIQKKHEYNLTRPHMHGGKKT
jgi:NTP pyrophosphatase (non-canonical NTP hydrolase)